MEYLYIYTNEYNNLKKVLTNFKTKQITDKNIKDILNNKIKFLIIDKENEKLFNITEKKKIITFTNFEKYRDNANYIFYKNTNELLKYIKIINDNLSKLFTIIVSIFNTYDYIDKCLNSIFNQTINNFKIYICDDYSNYDDYEKFKYKYSNINNLTIFRNSKNLGKFLTINLVLDKIDTDYYLIVDSDDQINKNKLLYDLINLNMQDDMIEIWGVQSKYIRFNKEKNKIIECDYGHNNVTFKRNIIKKIGYYCTNRFGSDTEFIMRIKKFIKNNPIIKYNKITYIAFIRNDFNNLTSIYNIEQRKKFIDKILTLYKNIDCQDIFINYKNDIFNDNILHKKTKELNIKEYKKFYLDIKDFTNDELLIHWKEKGINEGRLPNLSTFNYNYPNFDYSLFKKQNYNIIFKNKYQIFGWVFLKNKSNYDKWLIKNKYKCEKIYYDNIIKDIDLEYSFDNFIVNNKIKYINVSNALKHFEKNICNKFNLIKYNKLCDKFENVIFFGLYDNHDYIKLTNHIGKKYLMWGGTDVNVKYEFRKETVEKIKNYYDIINLSISNYINETLDKFNIEYIKIYLNMVNLDIFKPITNYGNSIYVYNGFTKGNENIYGKSIYLEVIKSFPKCEFIFSNDLNLPYEKMPEIYSKCFIGLRLTQHDGNANTVQEFNAMNIPIIFNGPGGIIWNNIKDIIDIILFYQNNNIDNDIDNYYNHKETDFNHKETDFNYKETDFNHKETKLNIIYKNNYELIIQNNKNENILFLNNNAKIYYRLEDFFINKKFYIQITNLNYLTNLNVIEYKNNKYEMIIYNKLLIVSIKYYLNFNIIVIISYLENLENLENLFNYLIIFMENLNKSKKILLNKVKEINYPNKNLQNKIKLYINDKQIIMQII